MSSGYRKISRWFPGTVFAFGTGNTDYNVTENKNSHAPNQQAQQWADMATWACTTFIQAQVAATRATAP